MSNSEKLNPIIMEQMRRIVESPGVRSVAFCSEKRRSWVLEKESPAPIEQKSASNMWQSLADSFLVLSLHHLEASRLQWSATEGTLAMVHLQGKGTMGMLLDSAIQNNQSSALLLQCEQALHQVK